MREFSFQVLLVKNMCRRGFVEDIELMREFLWKDSLRKTVSNERTFHTIKDSSLKTLS
jgi:hypothetical protein